jgi:hypothetical protein
MNQEDYLRNAIENARGAFIVAYVDYYRDFDHALYGSMLGAMRVYSRLANDTTGKLEEEAWQDAKNLWNYLVDNKLV